MRLLHISIVLCTWMFPNAPPKHTVPEGVEAVEVPGGLALLQQPGGHSVCQDLVVERNQLEEVLLVLFFGSFVGV